MLVTNILYNKKLNVLMLSFIICHNIGWFMSDKLIVKKLTLFIFFSPSALLKEEKEEEETLDDETNSDDFLSEDFDNSEVETPPV